MKKILSKQKSVKFVYCSSPVTIDMRAYWGDNPSNIQNAPRGAFLKMKNDWEVSHLVQPNTAKDSPVGWVKTDCPGFFDKAPICVGNSVPPGTVVEIQTLDGPVAISYDEESMWCYNLNEDGTVNEEDVWLQKISEIRKNYELE